jgi:ABC-type phosphate/phosphonate transport system permease subunit
MTTFSHAHPATTRSPYRCEHADVTPMTMTHILLSLMGGLLSVPVALGLALVAERSVTRCEAARWARLTPAQQVQKAARLRWQAEWNSGLHLPD